MSTVLDVYTPNEQRHLQVTSAQYGEIETARDVDGVQVVRAAVRQLGPIQLIKRVFVGSPPVHDRILDFSTAVTGTTFFVPSRQFISDLDS